MSYALTFPVRLLLSGLALAAPAAAQQKSEAEAKAEIDFARGLAAEYSFVDLAEDVLRELEREGVSMSMSERLGLVRCEVYSIGAKNASEPEERHRLFDEALAAYEDFIAANPASPHTPKAEAAYVDTSAAYARSLRLSLEEAVGEEATALGERLRTVLEEAVALTADLIESLKTIPADERSSEETRELYDLMLNRGQMLAEIGRAQVLAGQDGTFMFNTAIAVLESLVFEALEGTPYALRAYVAMGDVYAYQQKWPEAATFYQAVIDQAIPVEREVWESLVDEQELTEGQKVLRFLFLEVATRGALAAFFNAGELENAARYALHFYNTQRREGFNLSVRGYLSLLQVARTILDVGGYIGGNLVDGEAVWYATEEEMDENHPSRYQTTSVDFALRLAQRVNQENKGNTLQIRAQSLISDVIDRPDVVVSPEILFEAAEGEYNERNYFDALRGYRRVLRSIDGEDQLTRMEYGAKVMAQIGNCFRRLDRHLEAAMAFREGCTQWQDPALNARNAQAFYGALQIVKRSANQSTEYLDELSREAENLVVSMEGIGEDSVHWNRGEKARGNKEFEEAIGYYEKIEPSSDHYEKAKVAIGRCYFRMGQTEKALEVFNEYLEEYVVDPKNAISSPSAQARRKEATVLAEFFRGLMSHIRAEESGDDADYRKVIEYLSDFHVDYADQTSLAPWCMELVVESHLALGQREEARATLEQMNELFPESGRTASTAITFYKTLKTAQEEATDPEVKRRLLREMAEHLDRANSLSASPSYSNLRAESRHWFDLGEWAKAAEVSREIVERWGQDEEQQDNLRQYVLPDLGHALLRQQKVADAKAVLQDLALDEENLAQKQTVLDWCRSVVGWVEGSGSDIREVVGAGGTDEELGAVTQKLNAVEGSTETWTCEWYRYKFMAIYAYYAWGQQDSRKIDTARNVLQSVVSLTGDDFGYVEEACSSEDIDRELRERFGDGVLQERYRWLHQRLR